MARSSLSSVKAYCYGVAILATTVASVGCQSDYAGQTLPSPYWQKDDIQYFPPGPEFKLSREAAAMKAYGTGRASRPAVGPLGPAEGPAPSGELNGAAPGVVVPPPPGPVAPPPGPAGAAAVPADAAPPPAEEPGEDPFNP